MTPSKRIMRSYIIYLVVLLLTAYALKDWFKSLCGLILLMAVIERPDMPYNILGIPGLRPWNVLFVVVLVVWAMRRRRHGMTWDMPRHIAVALTLYLGVIGIGVLRAAFDPEGLIRYSASGLIMDKLVNPFKWVVVGIILYDSCRTRRQVVQALFCILAVYLIIAGLVLKAAPASAFRGGGVGHKRFNEAVGYHQTDISVMLAGACWAMVAAKPLVKKKQHKIALLGLAGLVLLAQSVTGGRGGYVAWGATGFMLCLIKWRKYLLLAPVAVILLPIAFPGAVARMLSGFGATDVTGETTIDEEAATSGRTLIWPYVIEKIEQSPLIGYGRSAMQRTGLFYTLEDEHPGTGAPHPHNMYLETLLDNGILGSLPIFIFWAMVLVHSAILFRRSNRLYSAVGGVSFSLSCASLIAGISGQHFYPQEHTMCIWAALFLMLRVSVEEQRTQAVEARADGYSIEYSVSGDQWVNSSLSA